MSLDTAGSAAAADDQAAGLRRLFGSTRQRFVALAHNAEVVHATLAIERLCDAAATLGLHTLVVDAADSAPAPHEMALLDLPSCIEAVSPEVSYLAARGLPIRHVDSRGRCGGFLQAIEQAAPQADLVLVHAGTVDLARLFAERRMRALLLGADTPRAMTEAYAALKRLAQRPGWLAHDLLIVADPRGPRTARLGESLAQCAERFLGAAIHDCVVIDPDADPAPDARLARLLRAQIAPLPDGTAMPLAQHASAMH
ncbi:MAG TPA: flagellar biosynthesis protein [Burkholderiaceae bacterium]|nr:flagellar biosynthesis protein [Burkholderiaceae bacterium]